MTGALDGTHALITGGGTGIGAAVARVLSKNGAAVSLVGRRKPPLDKTAQELKRAQTIVADVAREDDCVAMALAARKTFGPVDIVVANAGLAESAPIAKTSLAQWQRIMDVNATGAFLTVKAVLPDILRDEAAGRPRRIIFMASVAALRGGAYIAAYTASKHAVLGLTRALAAELDPGVVTANAVCPGYVDTPLVDAAVEKIAAQTGRPVEETRAALARRNKSGRFITPEEVAEKVLWLCLPESNGINGQAITIEGSEP
jgi:NAD(P)-dependent dehydrogenase (short-subunit alcohol dehydrogenase family)